MRRRKRRRRRRRRERRKMRRRRRRLKGRCAKSAYIPVGEAACVSCSRDVAIVS